jgi:prepilin-type N-terminal cleavage/methylation domain-containing protein
MFINRIHKQGFTLIELLVVIAIIGILSSVVLASLNTARQKARDARRISDVGQLQLALELYFDSNSGYPSALSALEGAGFIATVPTPPVGTTDTAYTLGGLLEDGTHTALSNDEDDDDAAETNQCPDEGAGSAKPAVSCDATGEYCVIP